MSDSLDWRRREWALSGQAAGLAGQASPAASAPSGLGPDAQLWIGFGNPRPGIGARMAGLGALPGGEEDLRAARAAMLWIVCCEDAQGSLRAYERAKALAYEGVLPPVGIVAAGSSEQAQPEAEERARRLAKALQGFLSREPQMLLGLREEGFAPIRNG